MADDPNDLLDLMGRMGPSDHEALIAQFIVSAETLRASQQAQRWNAR